MEIDREEIQRELEKQGMPEVYAYMAAQRATKSWRSCSGYFIGEIWELFAWRSTKEGHNFWAAVAHDLHHTQHQGA